MHSSVPLLRAPTGDEHRVSERLRHRLSHSGGFTLDPETSEQPRSGFAVCADRRLSTGIAWDAWDDRHVTRWLHSLSDDLRDGSYLGGWLDRGRGRAWLEVVVVVPADKRALAMDLARRAGQRAIFDLSTGVVVPAVASSVTTGPGPSRGSGDRRRITAVASAT